MQTGTLFSYDGNLVYRQVTNGTANNKYFCLNFKSGKKLWEINDSKEYDIASRDLIDGKTGEIAYTYLAPEGIGKISASDGVIVISNSCFVAYLKDYNFGKERSTRINWIFIIATSVVFLALAMIVLLVVRRKMRLSLQKQQ